MPVGTNDKVEQFIHSVNRRSAEMIKYASNDFLALKISCMNAVSVKESWLEQLRDYDAFTFVKGDLANKEALMTLFERYHFDKVFNLAAQAGVRENPDAYINSNIIGFYNILECCRHYPVKHLVFASSSSVYGANKKIPFSTEDKVDQPVSLYAATKKSNELLAYSYCKLYGIPATGLRFFTVYGPYGRPDMAYFKFTRAIEAGETIKVFNHGDMHRDFTYIDDIVEGVVRLLTYIPKQDENGATYKIYNIGKKAENEFLPMQPGDVYQTYADVTDLMADVGFKPETSLREGIGWFMDWYKEYYRK